MPSHIVLQNLVHSIPRGKQSAAYRLFHDHRRVRTQQLFTMNTRAMNEIGVSTTGDPELDRQLRTEWVHVALTAVEMTTFLHRGAGLMFDDPRVATALYLDLVEHLRGWLDLFDKNPNLRRAPLQDLQAFDELAAAVFPFASRDLLPNEEDAGYGAFLAKAARRRRTLFSEMAAAAAEDVPIKVSYKPLSDQIAEKLAKRLGK